MVVNGSALGCASSSGPAAGDLSGPWQWLGKETVAHVKRVLFHQCLWNVPGDGSGQPAFAKLGPWPSCQRAGSFPVSPACFLWKDTQEIP